MDLKPRERVEAAGRWLVTTGGSATPGELGRELGGLNRQRQAELLNALRAGGWVDGPKGRVQLTPAGWTRFAAVGQVGAGALLDQVFAAVWPDQLYAHRAMQRLHLSAVVARWHLYAERPDEHLTFVSRGAEGTGKTAVYRLACELLAVNPRTALVEPEDETAAALGGRRSTGPGGTLARDVPVIATLPLVVFDDVDKMSAEVRQAFWPYLRGSVWQGTESQERALRPAAAVTYNPKPGRDPDTLLPPGWARRSVLLDADYARTARGELRQSVRAYYRPERASQRLRNVLNLAVLVPPANSLDADALAVLDTVPQAFVDPHRAWPATGLELATLGRMALLGDGDQLRAAVATAVDYLMVTATTPGLVVQDWTGLSAALLEWEAETGRTEVADALAGYQKARRAHQSATRSGRVARDVQADSLVRRRGELVVELGQARDSVDGRKVPPARRSEAGGLRAVLAQLRTDAGNAKTVQALADVADRAAPHLADVERLHRQIEQDQAANVAALADQKAQRRQARDAERQMARQAKAALVAAARNYRAQQEYARTRTAETLAEVVATAKQLEQLYRRTTTKPDENPLRELCTVRPVGRPLLTYTAPPPAPAGASPRQRVTRWAAGGTYGRWTSTADSSITFPGKPERCPDLAQWGPGTRAVLAPMLRQLYDVEDQLRAQLGRVGRSRPDVVTAVSPRAQLTAGR